MKRLTLILLLALSIGGCKKNESQPEKLSDGCVKIQRKIAPNKIVFINPDTGKEQTFEGLGNSQWEIYKEGDVICKSAYFTY